MHRLTLLLLAAVLQWASPTWCLADTLDPAKIKAALRHSDKRVRTRTLLTLIEKQAGQRDALYSGYFAFGLRDHSAEVRALAIQGLALTPDARHLPQIIALLADKNEQVLSQALNALAKWGNSFSIPAVPVLKLLKRDEPALRAAAANTLATVGSRSRVLPALVSLLADKDPLVVESALAALHARQAPAIAEPLLLALLKHPRARTRQLAMITLAGMGSRRAIAPLIARLKQETALWTAVVRCLALIGGERAADALAVYLVPRGKHTAVLALALAKLGFRKHGPRLLMLLTQRLRRQQYDATSNALISAVGTLRVQNATKVLLRLVDQANKSSRGAFDLAVSAVYALGKLGDRSAARALEPLLRHRRTGLRAAAAQSLALLAQPDAVALLRPLLRDRRLTVVGTAIVGLADLKDTALRRDLPKLYTHRSPLIRLCAGYAALRLGDNAAGRRLISTLLTGKQRGSKLQALRFLGRLRKRVSIELLLRALADHDLAVRRATHRQLRRITGVRIAPEPTLWRNWWRQNRTRFPD